MSFTHYTPASPKFGVRCAIEKEDRKDSEVIERYRPKNFDPNHNSGFRPTALIGEILRFNSPTWSSAKGDLALLTICPKGDFSLLNEGGIGS